MTAVADGAPEIAARIAAVKDSVEQLAGPIDSSRGQAEALYSLMEQAGLEARATQTKAVVDQIEQAQTTRAGIDGFLAKAHWLMLSVANGNMGPGASSAVSGGSDGSQRTEPTPTAAGNFEPEDFDFDLFGDELPADQIVYTVPEAPPAPDSIDPEELTGKGRLDKMRQGLARGLGDAKENLEKANFDASDMVSDDYEPYSDTGSQTLTPSVGEPTVHVERPANEALNPGSLAGSLLAVTIFGVEVAGKIKDAAARKRD